MFFFGGLTIGNKLQDFDYLYLPGLAGSGGVTVTITAAGPGLLSATATGAGSSSISVVIPQGAQSTTFYIQGTAASGTVTYTATSTGLGSATRTATLAPSGIVIYNSIGSSSLTAQVGTNTDVIVQTGILTTGGVIPQALAGGSALTVPVNSSSSSVTIPNPVKIQPGSDRGTVTLSLMSPGSAAVTLANPPPTGFSYPGSTTVAVTVN